MYFSLADLFIDTLNGGNGCPFVVSDDTEGHSTFWAADWYKTILSSWKDHMT